MDTPDTPDEHREPAQQPGSPLVVVGVGQIRRRPALDSHGVWDPQEPARIMATAVAAALADVEANKSDAADLASAVDAFAVVDPISWGYNDLVGSTAQAAGVTPSVSLTWPPGGNSPGDLLHELAALVHSGAVKVAVLAGCETLYSVRRARKENIDLQQQWTPFQGRRDFLKGQRSMTTPVEARHGLVAPIQCYPLFENALRAAAGRTVEEHQHFVGELMSRNSAVAAENPNAWFPDKYSVDDIIDIAPDNRWVCFPYPKRMNAIMEVDQAAAIVVMSQAEADRRGIARTHQVRFLGGGSCQDPWAPAERPDLARSEGIAAAAAEAFRHSGLTIDDIDMIDLYSCFPSAVQFAMDALGVAAGDPRGVSLTGGLAYAGGPGNSYSLHSMCVAVERIRSGNGKTALVTSLGMAASKHAVSIFGNNEVAPRADSLGTKTYLSESQLHGPPLVDETSGDGRIVSYTAEFDRTGAAVKTVYIVDLDAGGRTVGNGPCDGEEIAQMLTTELVGRRASVTAGSTSVDGPGTPNQVVLR